MMTDYSSPIETERTHHTSVEQDEKDMFEIEDFTCSSSWETLVSHIENALRSWKLQAAGLPDDECVLQGPDGKYLQALLYFKGTPLSLQYHFQEPSESDGQFEEILRKHFPDKIPQSFQQMLCPSLPSDHENEYDSDLDIRKWFGFRNYLLLECPALNNNEAALLLSSLCFVGPKIPVFVPVRSRSPTILIGRLSDCLHSCQLQVQTSRRVPKTLQHLSTIEQYFSDRLMSSSSSPSETAFVISVSHSYQSQAFLVSSHSHPQQSNSTEESQMELQSDLNSIELILEVHWPAFISGTRVENALYSDFDPVSASSWKLRLVDRTDEYYCTHSQNIGTFIRNMERSPRHSSSQDSHEASHGHQQQIAAELDLFIFEVFSKSSDVLRAFVNGVVTYKSELVIDAWKRFIRKIRHLWEHGHDIPLSDLDIDLRAPLILQKLQLLSKCTGDVEICKPQQEKEFYLLSGDVMVLPSTQQHPPTTSDLLEEHQQLLEALGTSTEASLLRGELQGRTVLSDMQSFKASNPLGVFADFVRWYSPNDYCDGALSCRMEDSDNLWNRLWEEAQPIPASEQEPLFDKSKQAEKALYYLETISSFQLFNQLASLSLSHSFEQVFSSVCERFSSEKIIQQVQKVSGTRGISELEQTEIFVETLFKVGKLFQDEELVLSLMLNDSVSFSQDNPSERENVQVYFMVDGEFIEPFLKEIRLSGCSRSKDSVQSTAHQMFVQKSGSDFLLATAWSRIDD